MVLIAVSAISVVLMLIVTRWTMLSIWHRASRQIPTSPYILNFGNELVVCLEISLAGTMNGFKTPQESNFLRVPVDQNSLLLLRLELSTLTRF